MAASEFSAGDVVVLKSGGPKMTVKGAGDNAYGRYVVTCNWFIEGVLKQDTFSPEVLKKADD